MKILGRHLIAEFAQCNGSKLNDAEFLERSLKDAARESGATIVQSIFHRYNPAGISGVVVIAESHLSIHTWPEYDYAAVDFFTCGQSVDPHKAFEVMKQALGSQMAELREFDRGIPSSRNEIIDHKPMPSTSRPAAVG